MVVALWLCHLDEVLIDFTEELSYAVLASNMAVVYKEKTHICK